MSRIGNNPITIEPNVEIVNKERTISAKGPKGELSMEIPEGILVNVEDNQITFTRSNDDKKTKAFHGLSRALVNNMIEGVTKGFEKKLEVNGVGFKVAASGNTLNMSLGFSHPVVYEVPEGLSVGVDQNIITISGISKQQVGQTAAEIRALKKPEPYKGKGIKYVDETIIRKAGKAAGGE